MNLQVGPVCQGFQDKVVDFRRFVACSLDLEDRLSA